MASKNVVIKRKIGNDIYELLPKTSGAQVEVSYAGTVQTLAAALSTIYTDVNSWNTFKADVDFAGTDSALDTLRELIDMISKEDVATSIAGELKAIKENIDQVEADLAELQQTVADNKTSADNNYNANKALIEGLRTDVDANTAQVALNKAAHEKNATDITAVGGRVDTLETDNTANKAAIAKNAEDIIAVGGRVTTLETDNTDNKAAIAENAAAISRINDIAGAQARVIVAEEVPEDLSEHDLFMQIVE